MNLLLLAQIPPPVHGAALINKAVLDQAKDFPNTSLTHCNISAATTISDMQKSAVVKFIRSISIVIKAFFFALDTRYEWKYINASPSGIPSVRDTIFVIAAMWTSRRTLVQFHGQLHSHSIFSKLARYHLLNRNVSFIFLDECLIPKDILQSGYQLDILSNFCPDEDDFKKITRTSRSPARVIFLANMLPAKGIGDFLEICAVCLRSGLDFHVTTAGAWTDKYQQRDYDLWLEGQSDIKHRFNHVGFVDQKDKLKLLESADIFVYPTKNDAFPLVILEAMASGTAVIASDVGAIPNIISDGDLICGRNDINQFCSKLAQLLSNPKLLLEKQVNLRERYFSMFSLEKFSSNLRSILNPKGKDS